MKLWHMLFSGHRWKVLGWTWNAPNQALAEFHISHYTPNAETKSLWVSRAVHGWSESILTCQCGAITTARLTGRTMGVTH